MGASALVLGGILALFAVIFIVPFVEMWPFRPSFTLDYVAAIFTDAELFSMLTNSIAVAVATAVLGCILAYAAALVVARSNLPRAAKRAVDAISSVINTVPGMVLGIAFLFAFSGTSLQGTFAILVLCNVVHYFATPYQMMKDALTKMSASWETTARLMGDSWVKTILRVVTPNAWPTILQVFGYYFVSSMVTISAVVFLVGARTMVVTTRISALQHIAEFDGIFALSLVILVVNMLVKGLVALACRDRSARSVRTSVRMRGTGRSDALEAEVLLGRPNRMPARLMAGALLIVSVVAVAGIGASLAARERGEDDGSGVPSGQVVIASNGDAEAVEALGVRDVRNVVKVGDTVSDIREGLCAGVRSIGVAEGSSVMGLTQAECEALDSAGQDAACERAARVLREAGAADVVRNLSELPGLLGL